MRPDYIGFDSKQREELLSQRGNFTPNERDVFHKLCQNWQERIPYNRFISHLNHDSGGTTSDLVSLMGKLRDARLGLLRTKIEDGARVRDAIILTRENSAPFFVELADEYFNDVLESIVNPLPLLEHIRDQLGDIPPSVVQPVSPDELPAYFSRERTTELPLLVPTLDGATVLVNQSRLRPFISVAIAKLRYFLTNTSLLGAVAKLMDTSLLSLKQQIAGKDPMFWVGLTKLVVEHRKDFEAMRSVSVDGNFFHAAAILRNLIEAQITEAKQKKQAEENRQLDLDAIAIAVKESPSEWLTQQEISDLLEGQKEKYGDDFDAFREEFYERYVHSRGKNALPRIVLLSRRYIHRDNVFPVFLIHFRELESDLANHFALQMEQQLKSGNRKKDHTFISLQNFNEAIMDQVRARSDYVAALIDKPSILAEAMILHAKQNKLVKDVNELKQRLSVYFDPDTMQPLPLNEWFNLRPIELFERAFETLPILKRIWIRLTGKYESFRGRYLGQSAASSAAAAGATGAPARDIDRREKSGRDRGGHRESASSATHRTAGGSGRRGSAAAAKARGPAAGPAVKRAYSKKQVDSAWDEFGSTIKKKND